MHNLENIWKRKRGLILFGALGVLVLVNSVSPLRGALLSGINLSFVQEAHAQAAAAPTPTPTPTPTTKPNTFFTDAVTSQGSELLGLDKVQNDIKEVGGSLAYAALASVAFFISWLAGIIFGVAIAFEAWAIEVILNINTKIVQTSPVQQGFSATLAVANLGFVLAIVVISIATILRVESYGMKKSLSKLIIAAILVNFSLVIGGTIVNFADQITLSFINGANGNGINPAGGGASYTGFSTFASKIAGAFNPQQAVMFGIGGATSTASAEDTAKVTQTLAVQGQSVGSFVIPIVGLLFSFGTLFIIFITLGTLVVLLLYRYVAISILLILMPLAWLLWIFEITRSNWSRWWNNFIRWSFFPIPVVFFIWLGLLIATDMSSSGSISFSQYTTTTGTGAWNSIVVFFGGAFTTVIQATLQAIVLAGIMYGGMIVANSLSMDGAKYAVAAGKGFQTWANKKGKQGATWPLRTKAGRAATDKLQQVGANRGILGRMAGYGVRYAGRGLEVAAKQGSEGLIDQEQKWIDKKSSDEIKRNLTTFTKPQRIAALKVLERRGDLDKVPVDALASESDFAQFGQSKLQRDINKALLSDVNVREAAKVLGEAREGITVTDDAGVLGEAGKELPVTEVKTKVEELTKQKREEAERWRKEAAEAILPETKKEYESRAAGFDEEADTIENFGKAATTKANASLASVKMKDTRGVLGTKNATVSAVQLAQKAEGDFLTTLKKGDVSEDAVGKLFSGKESFGLDPTTLRELTDILAHGTVDKAPILTGSIIPKLPASQLDSFQKVFLEKTETLIQKAMSENNKVEETRLRKYKKELKDSIANNVMRDGGRRRRNRERPDKEEGGGDTKKE